MCSRPSKHLPAGRLARAALMIAAIGWIAGASAAWEGGYDSAVLSAKDPKAPPVRVDVSFTPPQGSEAGQLQFPLQGCKFKLQQVGDEKYLIKRLNMTQGVQGYCTAWIDGTAELRKTNDPDMVEIWLAGRNAPPSADSPFRVYLHKH